MLYSKGKGCIGNNTVGVHVALVSPPVGYENYPWPPVGRGKWDASPLAPGARLPSKPGVVMQMVCLRPHCPAWEPSAAQAVEP